MTNDARAPRMNGDTAPQPRPPVWTVAALFFGVTCVMVFPLSAVWQPRLPLTEDSMFNVWRLAWVAHALKTQPAHLFDANIFYPARNTLAYSDAMIGLGLLSAPFQWAGAHPVLIHNVLLVLAFFLAACGAFALSWRLMHNTGASVLAGVVFAFAPYRFAHIAHLELLWTAPMPLAVLLTLRLFDTPTLGRAVTLGLCVALQGLLGIYYCIFLCIFLLFFVALTMLVARPRMLRAHGAAAAVVVLVAAVVLGPYAWPYADASQHLPDRPPEEIRRYSAVPSDYLQVGSNNRLYHRVPREAADEHSLFPGATAIVLGVMGFAVAATNRARGVMIFGALAVLAFDLSTGLNGWLYPSLLELASPLRGLRAPARFGVLVLLCISVLSAYGLHWMFGRSRFRSAAAAVAVCLCLGEYWSAPVATREVPIQPLRVHQWLATQPQGPILELPVPQPSSLWLYEATYEYLSIYHWRPLVNGYSGYAPVDYVRTLEILREFPFGQSEAFLRRAGIRFVLVHERYAGSQRFAELLADVRKTSFLGEPRLFPNGSDAVAVLPVLP
jgi:hypothetical protein